MTDFSAFKLGLAAGITVGLAQYAALPEAGTFVGAAIGLEEFFDQALLQLTVTNTGVAGDTFTFSAGELTVDDRMQFTLFGVSCTTGCLKTPWHEWLSGYPDGYWNENPDYVVFIEDGVVQTFSLDDEYRILIDLDTGAEVRADDDIKPNGRYGL